MTTIQPPNKIDDKEIEDHETDDLRNYLQQIDDFIDQNKLMRNQRASVWHVIVKEQIIDELDERGEDSTI